MRTSVSTEQTQIDQKDDKGEKVQQQQDAQLGQKVRQIIRKNGGIAHFKNNYEVLSALQNNNYLPLLQPYYRRYRATFFRLTQQLSIRTTVQSKGLLQALDFIQERRNSHAEYLPDEIGLSFATPRWRKLIRRKEDGGMKLHKGHLEACIFSVIGGGLSNGDLYITGSEQFADYRTQLLSWEACKPLLKDYCEAVQLPTTSTEFITQLREQMQQMIEQVNETYTENDTFYFDQNGKPHLRQLSKRTVPDNAEELQDEMQSRMPERHLLDVLHHVHQWVPYTRHFTPPSGSDPKLQDPATSYQLTIFSYGSNMGPTQTARHLRGPVTARVIARLNKQHVTTPKLDTANGDIINEYVRFNLPRQWGSQHVAVADGTHYELYENNLMGERHIRYGAYGGIAYHHISDTYVALFSHFIACGVWEAVYILDGLLKNKSVLQPDTVHADTQGQSEAVFGLAHLLGIQLMPRMRNWNKVTMYRPDSNATYQNIGSWFSRTIDWDLLADHWEYLMQVTLSIHKGKVLPSWLLQKLNSDNPKNKLYLALRELGRVHRTLFLLQYVSKPQLRRQIQAATTKIEAYNLFSQWIFFGGDSIMKSRDPVEYEKRIKYKDLIANAIMLHNVVDMTNVLHEMAQEGYPVTPEVVATFSPYITEHIKRFGEYVIDTDSTPPPLQPDKPFLAKDVLG